MLLVLSMCTYDIGIRSVYVCYWHQKCVRMLVALKVCQASINSFYFQQNRPVLHQTSQHRQSYCVDDFHDLFVYYSRTILTQQGLNCIIGQLVVCVHLFFFVSNSNVSLSSYLTFENNIRIAWQWKLLGQLSLYQLCLIEELIVEWIHVKFNVCIIIDKRCCFFKSLIGG